MTAAKRRWLLWLVPPAMLLAVGLAALVRYQGLLVPVQIASGSMAEQLLGPHRLVSCAECGIAFRCGLDTEAPLQLATCPNCGFRRNDLALATLFEGDRVLIDRWAYAGATPRRGDVVAFVDPTNDTELAVKRVMGLPNEAVTIRRGELFINGQLHRKSLAETKQLATLVYDDAYRPLDERELPARWTSDDSATGWQATRDGHHWTPNQASATTDDWIMYRHWRCYTSPHPRTEESPVTDNDAYNQGLSRELHEVTDLLLSCDVSLAEEGQVALLIHDGHESFIATLSAKARSLSLVRGEDVWDRVALPSRVDSRQFSVDFGVIDD
ncbi:MAG: signal peptidase I, partial [Planctomycetota bacterium]